MLIGILLDVSGSMKGKLCSGTNTSITDNDMSRAEYTIRSILDICEKEEDKTKKNEIFVLVFGLLGNTCADLVQILETLSDHRNSAVANPKESLVRLLAENGAPNCEEYINKFVTEKEASFFYEIYRERLREVEEIVETLPAQCKWKASEFTTDTVEYVSNPLTFLLWAPMAAKLEAASSQLGILGWPRTAAKLEFVSNQLRVFSRTAVEDRRKSATRENVNAAMIKALSILANPKVQSLTDVAKLIRSFVKDDVAPGETSSLTKGQLDNLMNDVEPYIYQGTPMCQALCTAIDMFKKTTQDEKVLLILTDGEATDGKPSSYAIELGLLDVMVYSVLLTYENISFPKKLYFNPDQTWSKAHKEMFTLGTAVDNSNSVLSILLENGWELSPEGQSRLCIQANNPEIVDEFTSVVNQMFRCGSAVWNLYSRVSVDMYISIESSKLMPNEQVGGTCYANAVAAAIHLATLRIWGKGWRVGDIKYTYKKIHLHISIIF